MTPVHPRLAARRRRIQRIRVAVAAFTAALFIAVFSTVYAQMAAGRDPALSASSSSQAAQATTSPDSTASSDDSSAMTTSAS